MRTWGHDKPHLQRHLSAKCRNSLQQIPALLGVHQADQGVAQLDPHRVHAEQALDILVPGGRRGLGGQSLRGGFGRPRLGLALPPAGQDSAPT